MELPGLSSTDYSSGSSTHIDLSSPKAEDLERSQQCQPRGSRIPSTSNSSSTFRAGSPSDGSNIDPAVSRSSRDSFKVRREENYPGDDDSRGLFDHNQMDSGDFDTRGGGGGGDSSSILGLPQADDGMIGPASQPDPSMETSPAGDHRFDHGMLISDKSTSPLDFLRGVGGDGGGADSMMQLVASSPLNSSRASMASGKHEMDRLKTQTAAESAQTRLEHLQKERSEQAQLIERTRDRIKTLKHALQKCRLFI